MTYDTLGGRWMLIDGYDALGTGGQVKELDGANGKATLEETTAINETRPSRAATGHVDDDAVRLLAWVSDDTYALLDELCHDWTTAAVGRVVCWGEYTADEATRCWAGLAYEGTSKRLVPGKELTKAEIELLFTDGIRPAFVLYPLTTNANATWNTEAASVNNGTMGSAITITSSSVASPTEITCAAVHNLVSGDTVLIAGHSSSTPDINGSHVVTVTSTTKFTIAVNVSVGGTGGTATRTSTRSGGWIFQHVTALSLGGYTSFDGSVQHSSDNITFAALASFATVTVKPAAERVAITGSINRYTAYYGAYTGTGTGQTVTVMAAIARKEL